MKLTKSLITAGIASVVLVSHAANANHLFACEVTVDPASTIGYPTGQGYPAANIEPTYPRASGSEALPTASPFTDTGHAAPRLNEVIRSATDKSVAATMTAAASKALSRDSVFNDPGHVASEVVADPSHVGTRDGLIT